MATAAEQLTAIEDAISARLSGGLVKSYSYGGRELQYISLTELYAIRDKLKEEIAASQGGSRNYVQFQSPI